MKDYKIYLEGQFTAKRGHRTIKANSIQEAGEKATKLWKNCFILKVERING